MSRLFVRVLAAGLLTLPLTAAGQSGDLEEIIVTGSHIKGSAEDAPSPVQLLGRESIVASGASDVAEVIRNLEIASGSDTAPTDGARFNGGAGAGLANVNLRGLGPTSTLVLLDGKRLPYAGQKLSDGDRFVDINTIPVTMIERVEVLKNGASATYGSDAIAGVVNFITRSDFEGFEISGKWQSTTEGSQEDATLGAIFGWASDDGKSNFVIGGEYFDRGLLESSERPDLRRDLYERQDASIVNRFSVTGGDPNCEAVGEDFFRDNGESSDPFSCNRHGSETGVMIPDQKRGSVMADFRYGFSEGVEFYAQASYMEGRSGQRRPVHAGPIEPKYFIPFLLGATSGVPQPDLGWPNDPSLINNGGPLPPPAFTPPGLFPLELADYTLRVPGIEADRSYDGHNETQNWRVSAGLRGDFELGAKAWNYDFSVTHGENNFSTHTLEIDKDRLELAMYGLGGPNCQPNGSVDPADPRAAAARFLLAGADGQFDDTATAPGAVGPLEPTFIALSGPLPGFPYINEDNLVMAMTSSNMGDAAQGCYFFNPFLNRAAAGGTGANSEELLRWLEIPMDNYQETDTFLTSVDFVVGGELFEFNGHMVQLAVGAQYREEGRETAVNPQITGSVNSFGRLSGGTSVGGLSENRNFDAERDVWAVFAELAIPIGDDIDVQLAGRYEDYGGDIGSTFDPKLALRWQTTDSFVLRGAVSSSFRGPALAQIEEGTGYSLEFGVRDYLGSQANPAGENCVRTGRCGIPSDDAASAITIVKQGLETPDLMPESAISWNLGAIWSPVSGPLEGLTVGADYYQINFEDKIIDVPTQAYLTAELDLFEQALAAGDFTIVDPTLATFGDACNPNDAIYDPGNPLGEACQVNPAAYSITPGVTEFDGNVLRRPDRTRSLQIISSRAINTGKVDVSGIDANLNYVWDSGIGQWQVDSRLNYIISHDVKDFPTGQPDYDAAGWANRGPDRRISRSMPDLKGNVGLSWYNNRHFARLNMRFVGSYKDDSQPSLRLEEEFDPYFAFDLNYSYTFELGGNGELQMSLGAIDLFDADLPNVRDSRGVDLYTFDQRGRRLYASLLYRL